MPRLALLLALSGALACFAGAPAGASPLSPPGVTPAPAHDTYVPGQLIVKFRSGTDAAERGRALRSRDMRVLRAMPDMPVRLVGLADGANVQRTAAALESDPAVAWTVPNTIQQAGSVPDDSLFNQQWGLHNSGQAVDGVAGAAGADIRAPEAWDVTTGSRDVTVAVIDSGITFKQPDLAPNIWSNPGETGGGREHNGIDDDGNGFVDDAHGWDFVGADNDPTDNEGHGTHVSGIIGARGNNGIGVAGVAWNVSIMPVRALNNLRTGNCWDVANAITYAAAAGARVANMSIWGHSGCPLEEDAIAAAPDTLFVVIAGNDSEDINGDPAYPCAFPEPNIICVAGTDSSDHLGTYSNWGADYVDIAAPGTAIESTYPKWGDTQTIWSDDFEGSLVGNWAPGIGADWVRTTANPHGGSWSITDSPIGNYSNNAANYIDMLQGLNLTGRTDCGVRAWTKRSLSDSDALIGETSRDGSTLAGGIVVDGSTSGYEKALFDLGPLDGRPGGRFLFMLSSNASGTADGVYLDDVSVFCVPPLTDYTGAPDEFILDDGTSMAAPHVAGVAALVLSLDPSMSVAKLKDQILSTADPVAGLSGLVATGGRLDAARAVEFGRRPASGPGGTATGPTKAGGRPANRLAGPLGTLRKLLAHMGRAKLLRQGGLTVGLAAREAGRFRVVLTAPAGGKAGASRTATIAIGARSTARAGRVAVRVKLTRAGRRILRAGARTRATVTLRFAPKSGAGLSSSARVLLR